LLLRAERRHWACLHRFTTVPIRRHADRPGSGSV